MPRNQSSSAFGADVSSTCTDSLPGHRSQRGRAVAQTLAELCYGFHARRLSRSRLYRLKSSNSIGRTLHDLVSPYYPPARSFFLRLLRHMWGVSMALRRLDRSFAVLRYSRHTLAPFLGLPQYLRLQGCASPCTLAGFSCCQLLVFHDSCMVLLLLGFGIWNLFATVRASQSSLCTPAADVPLQCALRAYVCFRLAVS